MEEIEVETVLKERWTVEWTRDRCEVTDGTGMGRRYKHEGDVAPGIPDKVKEVARRCIIANRPLEEDEFRNGYGVINGFMVRRGEFKIDGWEWWESIDTAPERIREAHDRKFPKRKTLEELCIDLSDAVDTYGGGSKECIKAFAELLGEIQDNQWRPISEFVANGKHWEFLGSGVYDSTSPYNDGATHFRKFVRPEDE